MKIMKKKMMGIFVCMLMLATLPLAAGAVNSEPDVETTESIFGWTVIRGFIFNIKKEGNDLYFRCIRLHYSEITGMESSFGVIKFKRCRISDMGPDRMLTFGPLGSYTWIFGLCHGGITELGP